MGNIKARRALSDLFKTGTEIRFGPGAPGEGPKCELGPFFRKDDQGHDTDERLPPKADQVVMWIQPADPLQREQSMREANAKRAASIVRAKRDKESEEHLTAMAFIADMSDKTLIEYVLIGNSGLRQAAAEREILARDEWKEMSAYQDAMRQFADKDAADLEDDPDWQALIDLDDKYGEQCREREQELAETEREALEFACRANRAEVEKQALNKRAELAASSVFLNEYDRWMTYYACRDFEKTTDLFFDHPDELSRQPEPVRELIADALMPYIADAGEAKNSLGAADGSDSSVQPSEPETSALSTPVGQSA